MANVNETLSALMGIDGAMAAAIVDSNSGMVLGKAGGGLDLDLAGAGNTEVVRAKLKTMKALGLQDRIEDMLITLRKAKGTSRPAFTTIRRLATTRGATRHMTGCVSKLVSYTSPPRPQSPTARRSSRFPRKRTEP